MRNPEAHYTPVNCYQSNSRKRDSDSGDESENEATFSSCDQDEIDIVLAEIGSSSDEDDEAQVGNDGEMTSVIVTTWTRSGRHATQFLLN